MTLAIAVAPLLLTPFIGWVLMEYGPERSVVFAAYWLVLSIVFAVAMPVFRKRGRSLAASSALGLVVAMLITIVVFSVLLFAWTPRVATAAVQHSEMRGFPAGLVPSRLLDSDVPRA